MKLRRGWIGVLLYGAVVLCFIAALTGFYLAAMW